MKSEPDELREIFERIEHHLDALKRPLPLLDCVTWCVLTVTGMPRPLIEKHFAPYKTPKGPWPPDQWPPSNSTRFPPP
jgi:hypothetical protein